MGNHNQQEVHDDIIRGQAAIWHAIFSFVEAMTLKCVVQLGIPDIINSHGGSLSLSSIVENINHPSFNIDRLFRVMTLLVRRGIFTATSGTEGPDTMYGLTNSSKWLPDLKTSLAPMLLLQMNPVMLSSWQYLTDMITEEEGSSAFAKSNGAEFYNFTSVNHEFNALFNEAMAASSMITVEAVKKNYKDGFNGIESLVDVAGGTGAMIGEIVKQHPHIKGVNLDLPNVLAEAPEYAGVSHVAGDMFASIPPADAHILKWIMHNWKDDNCIKILRNCRKATTEENGKLIIIDTVLSEEGNGLFDEMIIIYDVLMMVLVNAKERNEQEWKFLLEEGGFPSYKIFKIPDQSYVIEAYPAKSSRESWKREIGAPEDPEDEDGMIKGQVEMLHCIFGYAEAMALKCIVQLGIPDIINSHGSPLSLSSIAKSANNPSLNTDRLLRVMKFLVRRGIFTATEVEDNKVTVYGLTNSSKWLVRDSKTSLAPMLLLQTSPWMLSSWQHLIDMVKEQEEEGSTTGFAKAHGINLFDFASMNPEYNALFNEAMARQSMIIVEAVKKYYKDGFDGIGSLVEVAGGTGAVIGEIVKAHPHVKGINFDLPDVVATAPEYAGVTHVAGDMFSSCVPQADAILLKWILHCWNDEDCVQILKNCRKAISEKAGKLIIIDAVLSPEGEELFDDLRFKLDLAMMIQLNGKERNEAEWKTLLEKGGFPKYKIIKIPALLSIIEAYPL